MEFSSIWVSISSIWFDAKENELRRALRQASEGKRGEGGTEMAFLFQIFTVVLSLCVVGLIVLALSSILASVRDDWRLKKPKREPRPGDY